MVTEMVTETTPFFWKDSAAVRARAASKPLSIADVPVRLCVRSHARRPRYQLTKFGGQRYQISGHDGMTPRKNYASATAELPVC